MADASDADADATATALTSAWLVCCSLSITFQLFRISIDTIQTASQNTSKDYEEDHHDAKNNNKNNSKSAGATSTFKAMKDLRLPGSMTSLATISSNGGSNNNDSHYGSINNRSAAKGESTPLIDSEDDDEEEDDDAAAASSSSPSPIIDSVHRNPLWECAPSHHKAAVWSLRIQCLLFLVLVGYASLGVGTIIPVEATAAAVGVIGLGVWLTLRDLPRRRMGWISRVAYISAALTMWIPMCHHYYHDRTHSDTGDELVLNTTGLYLLLALAETLFLDFPHQQQQQQQEQASPNDNKKKKKTLSRAAVLALLKPYFWPEETADSARLNRARAILTWVCVILSKICNLMAPMCLGWASTALAHQDYRTCIVYSIAYAMIQFVGSTFKEGQSLLYLKVAQAAFVQLSETTFVHLHTLSLDWHLQKKLGEVLRSMDRGIAACDTLMKYLFLWLVPAMVECLVVCIIFATYFQYTPLAVSVFYFVWLYIVWTILVTLWRKKFRKAVVQSDNEWHDRCTDSLLNFETVKYFTAEQYEARRFAESVEKFQQGSVQVQASLSFLNISQRFLLQVCLATALALSAMGIQLRVDCCLAHGCDSGISDCCQAMDHQTCPGMQVGDFVAVLTYVIQLFAPLNFLGTVYNAIVMAVIDLTNLSELLAEDPDVVDAPDAVPLPTINQDDPDIAVEFDNVTFHYPTQPSTKGLKGLSFQMKRGTTTAIVGSTGAGKTTISRLLFRFYDVLGGAVKMNGVDVRMVQQKSLRGAIGAVAQSSSLFSETIRSNLRYGRRDATDGELEQAAKDAQLLDFIESLDDGWDTKVGDRGLKLSGGERQRASIARCLLKDPPFVLLDEATSALDTLTENSVQDALDRLGTERTVLVIAHRLGTIRNADNIIVLKDGAVAEQGTHDQLLEGNGLYAEMWSMQLHSTTSSSAPGSQVSLMALNDTA